MARSLWDDIKQKLRRTEGYRKLLGEIGSRGEASVAGLVGSSRSLLVSTVVGDDAAPVFVLVPDQVTLEDVVEDLGLFGVEGVVGFYEEEVLPYDYHEPDMDIVGLQMSALNALRTGKAGVVVATVRSLMKKVIPRSGWVRRWIFMSLWRSSSIWVMRGTTSWRRRGSSP